MARALRAVTGKNSEGGDRVEEVGVRGRKIEAGIPFSDPSS